MGPQLQQKESGRCSTRISLVKGTISKFVLFQVGYVNFTWKSGVKKYYYNFDRLQSFDEKILEAPLISIKTRGRVPRRPKGVTTIISWKDSIIKIYYSKRIFETYSLRILVLVFSVLLPCSGNGSGIASFGIGLLIESRKGRPLPGTPLRLRLRKECAHRGEYLTGK